MRIGKPIEGVFVSNTGILGEVFAEQTGSDGRFVLSKIKEDASLIFMFSGYKTITMKPDFTSEMTVKMERDPEYKAPVSKSGSDGSSSTKTRATCCSGWSDI